MIYSKCLKKKTVTTEYSMEVPKKIKNKTTVSSRLLSIYLKKTKILILKDICAPPHVHCMLFMIAKWKQVSINEWKED